MPVLILFCGIQVIILLFLLIHLIRSFSIKRRKNPIFYATHITVEIVFSILFLVCFLLHELSPFQGENQFPIYSIFILSSFVFYWINKTLEKGSKMHFFSLVMTGTFFCLAFLTSIKLFQLLAFAWFPLLGFLAAAPIYLTLLSASDIKHQLISHPKITLLQTILLGMIPIGILQLVLNLFFENNWAFLTLFEPTPLRF